MGGSAVISAEALTTELWGARLPRRPIPAIHVYVSRLRKLLKDLGAREGTLVRAEALDVYQAARHALNIELGLDPSSSLRRVRYEVLNVV